MRLKKFKEKEGITLIALVITIVVLIILAGVAINMTVGENGILTKAKQAKQEYINAQIAEEQSLNELEKQLADYNKDLPENTKENPQEAGTEVRMPSNWYTTTPAYVSTEDGSIIKKPVKVASVTAVATGGGETVPVPVGFYYVGGTRSSGVVISDNKADQNKYASYTPDGTIVTEGIPTGVVYKEDGSQKRIVYDDAGNVILDEFTAEEKTTAILGNQFVWIPCKLKDYEKYDFGKRNSAWDTLTPLSEKIQIEKYGGFYIGRFEAGTSDIVLADNVKFENTSSTASNWSNGNYVASKVTSGKVTSKPGEIPYYHADYTTAKTLSEAMYNTSSVKSGLVTGTMFDVTLKFLQTDTSVDVTSSPWGNYNNSTLSKCGGRYLTVDSNGNITVVATKNTDGVRHYGIMTCGSTEEVKKKNVYDLAGNLWEWTDESCSTGYVYPTGDYILRGR